MIHKSDLHVHVTRVFLGLTLQLDVINIERTLSNRILSVKPRFKNYYKEPMFVILCGFICAARIHRRNGYKLKKGF